MRFNPRPPFRAGATKALAVSLAHGSVSILARPFERALQPTHRPQYWYSSQFQSSPALSSGRYFHTTSSMGAEGSFNPRPPFRAGATSSFV